MLFEDQDMSTELYHNRIDPMSFDHLYAATPEREYSGPRTVTSLFHAWSVLKLRSKCNPGNFQTLPTDVMLWGRGYGRHACTTRVGGMPAWTTGQELPSERMPGTRFFGQFNLSDSLDLFPDLKFPETLLSIWGTGEFPWKSSALRAFWLDPAEAIFSTGDPAVTVVEGMPMVPFYADLYRSWDPLPDQPLPTAQVDNQFESYRTYDLDDWKASKIGGVGDVWFDDRIPEHGSFVVQVEPIVAAANVLFPWVNQEKAMASGFSQGDVGHEDHIFYYGDGGVVTFHFNQKDEVNMIFRP